MSAWKKRQQVENEREGSVRDVDHHNINYITRKINGTNAMSFSDSWESEPSQEVYDHFLELGYDITERSIYDDLVTITFDWKNAAKEKMGTLVKKVDKN